MRSSALPSWAARAAASRRLRRPVGSSPRTPGSTHKKTPVRSTATRLCPACSSQRIIRRLQHPSVAFPSLIRVRCREGHELQRPLVPVATRRRRSGAQDAPRPWKAASLRIRPSRDWIAIRHVPGRRALHDAAQVRANADGRPSSRSRRYRLRAKPGVLSDGSACSCSALARSGTSDALRKDACSAICHPAPGMRPEPTRPGRPRSADAPPEPVRLRGNLGPFAGIRAIDLVLVGLHLV